MTGDAIKTGREPEQSGPTASAPSAGGSGGMGAQLKGMSYAQGVAALSPEAHADAVADMVVQGKSAEGLLAAGPSGGSVPSLQFKKSDITTGTDHMAGTQHIDAATRDEVMDLATTAKTSKEVGKLKEDGLLTNLTAAMDAGLEKVLAKREKAYQPGEGVEREWPRIQDLALVAEEAVLANFGGAIKASSGGAGHGPPDMSNADNLKEQHELYDNLPDDEAKDEMLLGLVVYILRQKDGTPFEVLDTHNVDLERAYDAALIVGWATEYRDNNREALARLQNLWPAETAGGVIFMQRGYVIPDEMKGATAPDAAVRAAYWNAFYYLIHECVHPCAHPDYTRAIAGTPMQNVLHEGVTEYFANQAWESLNIASNDELRKRVEGGEYDYAEEAIGELPQYPEIAEAKAVAGKVGDANLRAAYFMGHTELLGLDGWSAHNLEDRGWYYVTQDKHTLAHVALAVNAEVAELVRANGFPATDELAKGDGVEVPGLKWYVPTTSDTLDTISSATGIEAAAIARANPDVDFEHPDGIGVAVALPLR